MILVELPVRKCLVCISMSLAGVAWGRLGVSIWVTDGMWLMQDVGNRECP